MCSDIKQDVVVTSDWIDRSPGGGTERVRLGSRCRLVLHMLIETG